MSKTPFQAFIDLVALDQSIVTLKKECDLISQRLVEVNQNKQSLFTRLEDLRQQVQNARKAVDASELDMKMLDEKENTYKKRLDSVTNLKEYNSVRAELDALHEEQQNKEQYILDAWSSLDSAQNTYDAYQKDLDEKVRVCDEQLVSYKNQHDACIQRTQEQIANRPSKEHGIPSEWLEKYMIMQARVSDPVVPLKDETCSACFHNATKQDALSIQRGALMQCKGCYRLLYAPERLAHE